MDLAWRWTPLYLLATFSDWLQGAYVFSLYQTCGFEEGDIAFLFVAGFASSAVFGTFVASLADGFGRRRAAMAYGVLYGTACVLKMSCSYNVLLVGRLLSGVATSILYTAFEAWMVCEHRRLQLPAQTLSDTFSTASFGNGLVAIVAGLVASWSATMYGVRAPFMVSGALLFLCAFLVRVLWRENYGDEEASLREGLESAVQSMRDDPRIARVGLAQGLFEGAMYTFVFVWTPILQRAYTASPVHDVSDMSHGLVFAAFMVAIMAGSKLFAALSKVVALAQLLKITLLASFVTLAFPFVAGEYIEPSWAPWVMFGDFMLFEVCCGMSFPLFGTLRSVHIPEAARSATLNLFRLPLNVLVVIVLTSIESYSSIEILAFASLWPLIGAVLY